MKLQKFIILILFFVFGSFNKEPVNAFVNVKNDFVSHNNSIKKIENSAETISIPVWKVVLFVYSTIDVKFIDQYGIEQDFSYTITESEKNKAVWAFRQFASNAQRLSENETFIEYDVVFVSRTINTLTQLSQGYYWVSPNDIQIELDKYAPEGDYDSVFVYWPKNNLIEGIEIPSWGWGLALPASNWSNGSTYATVGNAPEWMWESPPNDLGEVWLHEWLHGVCNFYENKGYIMPSGDADGGGSHGYISTFEDGWSEYYHDLMTGNVLDNGILTGITPEAWKSGSILGTQYNGHIDHYFSNTIPDYEQTGFVSWDSGKQNIFLGNSIDSTDNLFYFDAEIKNNATVIGRIRVPETNIGIYDSVALAIRNGNDEYWATLAYGTLLSERGNISIKVNDDWGSLYPINLHSGWHTIKVYLDYKNDVIHMKIWDDNQNEPESWQLSRNFSPSLDVSKIGFRHYGNGIEIDDLYILASTKENFSWDLFIPMIVR